MTAFDHLSPQQFQPIYRGLRLGSPEGVDLSDPEQVFRHIRTRSDRELAAYADDYHRWPVFGMHWSTDHETALRFALSEGNSGEKYAALREKVIRHPRWGVVLEIGGSRAPHQKSFEAQDWYGEREVRPPNRADITHMLAHVHVRDDIGAYPAQSKKPTLIATHVMPREMWMRG